jgi:hypothetical protein
MTQRHLVTSAFGSAFVLADTQVPIGLIRAAASLRI